MPEKSWALVLGVSSGFGAATACALARKGHPVLGLHLDTRATMHRIDEVRARLTDSGVPFQLVNTNAADDRKRDSVLDDFQASHPDAHIGILLHSLAFGTLKPFVGEDEQRIRPRSMAMTVNVMAHSLVYWVQALLDRELLRQGGRVFAMTSSGSFVALPNYGAVSAAKASLEAHVRQLAVELAPRGVTVNAIMAGLAKTPALEKIPGCDKLIDQAVKRNPHGRLTTPDDVARCLIALSSPDTAWMTGNVIRVDGGETITV
jgi:NAD(P)-dependent dehydrogenase (short-subunit alcohol dehydrogenase family)